MGSAEPEDRRGPDESEILTPAITQLRRSKPDLSYLDSFASHGSPTGMLTRDVARPSVSWGKGMDLCDGDCR